MDQSRVPAWLVGNFPDSAMSGRSVENDSSLHQPGSFVARGKPAVDGPHGCAHGRESNAAKWKKRPELQ
jgi:hypothetical protein